MITATIITALALVMTLTMPRQLQPQSKTPAQLDCRRSGKVVDVRRLRIPARKIRQEDKRVHAELRAELASAVLALQASSLRLKHCMERHGL
jgi:hypothetical protein